MHSKDTDSFFKIFDAQCDLVFHKSDNLLKHFLWTKDWVKLIHPKNVYELHKILFEKQEGLNHPVSEENKFF